MPQFKYEPVAALAGQVASGNPKTENSYVNALLAQETDVAVAAAPAVGVYSFDVIAPEGTFTATYTSPGGESQNDIAIGLLASINGNPDFLNILTAAAPGNAVEMKFLHTGIVYSVTNLVAPGAALSVLDVVAPGGNDIGLGLAVVPAPAQTSGGVSGCYKVQAPSAATVDSDLLGFTTRNTLAAQINTGAQEDSMIPPGNAVGVLEEGEIYVQCEDSPGFNAQVFVRTDNGTAAAPLGGVRSDAGGGDAIAMTGARFRGPRTSEGLIRVAINRP